MLSVIEDQVYFQDELSFKTVPKLWKLLRQEIRCKPFITLNLSQVIFFDSAALVLLLQSYEEANLHASQLVLRDIPQGLLELARLSNIDGLLKGLT